MIFSFFLGMSVVVAASDYNHGKSQRPIFSRKDEEMTENKAA
jgi:hypothetical protein